MNNEINEITEIFDWVGKEIGNLELIDQTMVTMAILEFANKVKPIYKKYKDKNKPEEDEITRFLNMIWKNNPKLNGEEEDR